VVDNTAPTVGVNIVASALGPGNLSSSVAFTLSEASTDFTSDDVHVVGGSLTNFSGSGTTYTATFTADPSFAGTASVSVAAGTYHDAADNAGAAGSDTVTIVSASDLNDHDSDIPPTTAPPGFNLVVGDDNANILDTTTGGTKDLIYGGGGGDTISSGNGADTIYGQAGDDIINGGNQNDLIFGGSGNDIINGGEGSDEIYGGSGNDTIGGGSNGSDIIVGGYGQDILTGGNATDTFRYLSTFDSVTGAGDTITDFTAGSDTIDFAAITGATAVEGLVNTGDPIAAHSIAWVQSGADTIVYVNSTNTAGTADMEIHLTGVTAASLQSTDFLHA
jgi:Ca2+-binding RTX toxin-like protein